MLAKKKPKDWHKRFNSAKEPHVVTLHTDFAGVKAGLTMLISSPGHVANYVNKIPKGELRTAVRLRSDMAKTAGADSMCPVTASIFLRVVAEVALSDMEAGKDMANVPPFGRAIEPNSKLAAKLSCGVEGLVHLQRLD
ncbi:MAG: hypothetical protein ACRCT6_02290, partial [Notoacmeibacter sp.]